MINNQKNFTQINKNEIIKRANINNNNINYKINNLSDNQNLSNDRKINIIINNNVNSFRNTPYNTIDVNNIQNFKSKGNSLLNKTNDITIKKARIKKISEIESNSKDKIIVNDYNSYQYINKIPKKNNQNDELLLMKNNLGPIEKKYFNRENIIGLNTNYNNENTKTDNNNTYSNNSNNNTNKVDRMNYISNKGKFRTLDYHQIYNEQDKSHILKNININNNNNLLRINDYNNSGSLSKQSNMIGKMKFLKLNNNMHYLNHARTPTNNYNNNNWIINDKSPTKNNYTFHINNNEKSITNNNNINRAITMNNNLRQNNFSNHIYSYEALKYIKNKQNNINLFNNNMYKIRERNVYHSPDIIKQYRNKYISGPRSADAKRKSSNDSISNKMEKKGLNFNSNYIEDFNILGRINKNINNLNAKNNNNITPKCFNLMNI